MDSGSAVHLPQWHHVLSGPPGPGLGPGPGMVWAEVGASKVVATLRAARWEAPAPTPGGRAAPAAPRALRCRPLRTQVPPAGDRTNSESLTDGLDSASANLPRRAPLTGLRPGSRGEQVPRKGEAGGDGPARRPWGRFPSLPSDPGRIIKPTNLLSGKLSSCNTGSCYHGNKTASQPEPADSQAGPGCVSGALRSYRKSDPLKAD